MVLTNVYELGNYGISPWFTTLSNTIGFNDTNAKWIWYTINANNSAPNNSQSPIKIQYTYNNNTGTTIIANLKFIVDIFANVKLNNTTILSYISGGRIATINLIQGNNLIEFEAWNTRIGPAGLVVSVIRSSDSTILFNSNSDWHFENGYSNSPTNLIVIAGNTQVELTWTAPTFNGSSAIENYNIQYSSNNGIIWASRNTESIASSYTFIELNNGTNYIFKVGAVNSTGISLYSIQSTQITPISTVPIAPTNLIGTAGNTQVGLTWNVPISNATSAITNYNIQYSSNNGTNWNSITTGSTTSYTIITLTNGTNYIFKVAAYNLAGFWSSYSYQYARVTPISTVPIAPTDLIGTAGNTQIGLTWTAPTLAVTNYNIQYSSNNGITWDGGYTGNIKTCYTIINLTNGTSYIFKVGAVNSNGDSSYAYQYAQITPVSTVPIAPTNLIGTAGNTEVELMWNAPTSNSALVITNYNIKYSSDNGTTWSSVTTTGSTTSYTIINLTNGTSYIFKVAAYNLAGFRSSYSYQNVQVTPVSTVPIAPTNLIGTAGNTQIGLTWTASKSNGTSAITNYNIQYSSNNGSTWTAFLNGLSTNATITGLTNQTSYIFKVGAVNTTGTSSSMYQYTQITPVSTVPIAPTILTGTAGNTEIELMWTAPTSTGNSAIQNYNIQYSSNNGTTWSSVTTTGSITSYTIINLTNGTGYIFKAAAYNLSGFLSSYSSQSAKVTPVSTVPIAPTNLIGTVGNTQVGLSWTASASNGTSAIINYNIQYSSNNGTTWTAFLNGLSTNATITGLINQTSYIFKVGAVNSTGTSSFTYQYAQITPVSTVPTAPTNLIGTAVNTEVRLTWTAPTSNGNSDIQNYIIQYSSNNGTTWSSVTTTNSATSYTIINLTNGTSYIFKVAANNLSGFLSSYSSQSTQVTIAAIVPTVPIAPTNLTGTAGNTQVVLTWTAPTSNGGSAITDYQIQYKYTSGSTWNEWTTFSDGISTSTTGTITNLVNGTKYIFKVAAVNSIGTGSYSLESSTVIPATRPLEPTSLTTSSGNANIILTWTAPTSNGGASITDYQIQYKYTSGSTWSEWTTFSN